MDLSSLKSELEMSGMRSWSGQRSQSRRRIGICVPRPLLHQDLDDIKRCFQRANIRVDGYLDKKELKTYMELRHCPITEWEAEKLLEYADPKYHYYISLSQVTNLATYAGIGTLNPLRLTRSELEIAIQSVFGTEASPSPSSHSQALQDQEDPFDFNEVVNFFNSRTEANESDSESEDFNGEFNGEGVLSPKKSVERSTQTPDPSPRGRLRDQSHQFPSRAPSFTRWSYEDHDKIHGHEKEEMVDENPLQKVHVIKERWEAKIQELIDNKGDDFLVRLNEEKIAKTGDKRRVIMNTIIASLPPPLPQVPQPLTTPKVRSLYRKNMQTIPQEKKNYLNKKPPPPLPPPMVPELPPEFERSKSHFRSYRRW